MKKKKKCKNFECGGRRHEEMEYRILEKLLEYLETIFQKLEIMAEIFERRA